MRFISFKVCKLSAKSEFIDAARAGNVLARKCTKCDDLHLATVYFCKKCGKRGFDDVVLDGQGKVETYTIMTVPPTGFEKYAPYAWAVISLDNYDLRVSGFLPNIQKPGDLPIGTAVKVDGFGECGIVLKRL